MNKRLTNRQKKFIKFYNVEANATKAAIKAGYSKKTAYSSGQRLLKNVEVQNALQKKAEQLNEKLDISKERILREWALLAYSNIVDVVDASGQNVSLKDLSKLPEDVQRTVQSVSEGKFGVSIKLHDKKAGLEALSKHMQLWVDRSANVTVTYDLSKLPPEYLERIAAGENYVNVIAEYEHSIQSK